MEQLDKSRQTDVVGYNWQNYLCCMYYRALIGYLTRFTSWRLATTTSSIVGKDQRHNADVEVKTTDKKAKVYNSVEDQQPKRGRWRRDYAQTFFMEYEPMVHVAEIGNEQRIRIDQAREVCKEMVFGQDCNTTGKQMEQLSFCAILLAFP